MPLFDGRLSVAVLANVPGTTATQPLVWVAAIPAEPARNDFQLSPARKIERERGFFSDRNRVRCAGPTPQAEICPMGYMFP